MLSHKNNIGVFGLGKTGISVYDFIKDQANVVCYDDSESNRKVFTDLFGGKSLASLNDPIWQSLDRIVLSPGISLEHKIVLFADTHNIPIISDIDLLFESSSDANFIAVTGANGKSTTTALICYILQSNGLDYSAVGNIGHPALSDGANKSGYAIELSSFQLDLIKSFVPNISILLNITPDHLDRHKTMSAYIAAKKKIFNRMNKNSIAIINIDDNYSKNIYQELREQGVNLIPFSVLEILDKGISIVENKIYDNFFDSINLILPFNQNLQGLHNRQNIAASFAACRATGVKADKILDAISKFKGLPHRMQYVGSIDGISFYNDSKATNSEAASKSLAVLDNIYWLAGGISKGGGIENLLPYLGKIKKAYFFGEAKNFFAHTLQNKIEFEICDDLEEAFNLAFNDTFVDDKSKKNILLAPACASYDQFKNFEERGELFIKLYQKKLTKSNATK